LIALYVAGIDLPDRINVVILMMLSRPDIPKFNKRIFWDVNFDALDYEKKASFIIERVFERGDVPDIRNCRRYYGDERIREALTNAKWLSLTTIYLASAVLRNKLTDYRCYDTIRLNPGHSNY
jgi:nicotinamide mononucleotide adenylyltransferase